MAKATKFGTFAGVFTPSILTILGVIMYLRLGWVVGEGGLIMTIGIIVLAHIISISTGLSISSIATDKKIKTGGIYYILSRSLGLPMGGAIGITLFIGTALSIALYVVGFTENLLSVAPQINDFLGFETNTSLVRLIGTIVICLLVILAFISTSLVIKTQYFILGGIVLSLISIAIGFFTGSGNETGDIILSAASKESSFEDLFKVFFPAVTGFTAGVAMSGDLANPKKSIPTGTMASIVTGFFIYIVLAIGIAVFVDREMLINNSNFLMTVAWFSPLVLIGIWGATLSSALGGILGGPRILQATAKDKIMPSFLGIGYGASNEPRNALVIIFLIAEIGILIGELNVIAGVVSMFYLASYGFINLAFSLESWASTDFRPSFKISAWIGIVGFITSFAIMFKLDTVAMFAALIIMGLIFLALKRKEYRSDAGDVWQSVWTSIVRNALHKMEKNPMEERNWQPNIILFSGGSSHRPYLVEFGKKLVGKFGMLSNFDLIENRSSEILFPKHKQAIKRNETDKGIFYRRQTCKDIYQGVEVIASTYGFSGIEPNTILMGWARESKEPARFGSLIRNLYKLDLNVLLMDYDKRFGFGDKKSIDIWWRGEGHNNNLALLLAKFMLTSNDWDQAKIRLLIISSESQQNEKLYKKANYVLENLRISAEIKIINNRLDTRQVYDIISDESKETGLVFLGIPQIGYNQEEEFVKNTNKFLGDTGTVVMVKASSFFMKQKFFSAESNIKSIKSNVPLEKLIEEQIPVLEKYTLRVDFSEQLSFLFDELKGISEKFKLEYFLSQAIELSELINNYVITQNSNFEKLTTIKQNDFRESEKIIENMFDQTELFYESLNDFALRNIENQKNAIQFYQNELEKTIAKMPDNLYVKYDKAELSHHPDDDNAVKKYKRKLRLVTGIKGSQTRNQVKFKKILQKKLPGIAQHTLLDFVEKWDSGFYENIAHLNKTLQFTQFCIPPKSSEFENYKFACSLKKDDAQEAFSIFEEQQNYKTKIISQLNNIKVNFDYQIEDDTCQLFDNLNINDFTKQNKLEKENLKKLDNHLIQLPQKWHQIYWYFFNEIKLDNILGKTKLRLFQILQWFYLEIDELLQNSIGKKNTRLINDIILTQEQIQKNGKPLLENQFKVNELQTGDDFAVLAKTIEKCSNIINNQIHTIPDKFELLDDIIFTDLETNEIEESKSYTILANRLTEGIVANELTSLIHNTSNALSKQMRAIDNEIMNQNRLIKYSIFKEDGESKSIEDEEIDFQQFLSKNLHESRNISDKIDNISLNLFKELLEGFYKVNEKLQLYNFKHEANSWNQYLPTGTAITGISKVKKVYNSFSEFIDKQIDQFWYRQSDALLLAEDFSAKKEFNTPVYKFLNIIEQVSIKKKIISELPFFYKHLFLSRNYFNNDFWIGRKNELHRAETAYQRFVEGFPGALMISGERNSGKSFLVHYLCSEKLKLQKTIFIHPPDYGTANPKQLLKSIQNQTGKKGDINRILNSLDTASIIVFEDIELWWEKSEGGSKTLIHIFNALEKHCSRLFFILTINSYSYQLIRKMLQPESLFLDSIYCKPLNTKSLQEIVLFRHQASGLKFQLQPLHSIGGKIDEENFKSKHFANLFSRYFNYSKGNVGVCLLSWMANITRLKDNRIVMKLPKPINTKDLAQLDKDFVLLLYQLVLHRKMDLAKFSRVMMIEEEQAQKQIDFLNRSGFIVKTDTNYEISAYVQPAVVEILKNYDML